MAYLLLSAAAGNAHCEGRKTARFRTVETKITNSRRWPILLKKGARSAANADSLLFGSKMERIDDGTDERRRREAVLLFFA